MNIMTPDQLIGELSHNNDLRKAISNIAQQKTVGQPLSDLVTAVAQSNNSDYVIAAQLFHRQISYHIQNADEPKIIRQIISTAIGHLWEHEKLTILASKAGDLWVAHRTSSMREKLNEGWQEISSLAEAFGDDQNAKPTGNKPAPPTPPPAPPAKPTEVITADQIRAAFQSAVQYWKPGDKITNVDIRQGMFEALLGNRFYKAGQGQWRFDPYYLAVHVAIANAVAAGGGAGNGYPALQGTVDDKVFIFGSKAADPAEPTTAPSVVRQQQTATKTEVNIMPIVLGPGQLLVDVWIPAENIVIEFLAHRRMVPFSSDPISTSPLGWHICQEELAANFSNADMNDPLPRVIAISFTQEDLSGIRLKLCHETFLVGTVNDPDTAGYVRFTAILRDMPSVDLAFQHGPASLPIEMTLQLNTQGAAIVLDGFVGNLGTPQPILTATDMRINLVYGPSDVVELQSTGTATLQG